MTPDLEDFITGDKLYIQKHNANNATLRSNVNALLAAIGIAGATTGPFLKALFGSQVALIGSSSYVQSTASTTLTLSAGYEWRPDLGSIVYKGSTTALNFSGQTAATYYILIDASGVPSIQTASTFATYSVVWTGSAFGAITLLVPIIWSFGDWEDAQSSTALSATYVSLDDRLEADETLIVGVTGAQAANKFWVSPASGSAAAPTFRAAVVADLPFAGSALGVATLDGSGKVPIGQLPGAVAGALSYQGTWNATTNTPTLVSSAGTKGYYYKVATAGTSSIDGIAVWSVGDSIVFDGTTWDKIDGITNEVLSVAGKTGIVTLVAADVSGAEATANKDVANGYAGLDSSGLLKSAEFPATAVTAGSYGDGTHSGQFTVGADGRLTAAASVTITGAAPTGSAGGSLAGTYPNPAIASSVSLPGSPTTTTQSPGDNSTKVATTAYADASSAAAVAGVTGGMTFKGTWNATTNTPTITSGTGTLGWFYKVATAGTTTVDGNSSWIIGDILLYDGAAWLKIDGNSTEVTSVFGRVGAVTLALTDIPAQADGTILANISGGSAAPAVDTLTAVLDYIFGSTRGMTLYRGASAWAALAAGTSGLFLQTKGTGGDPAWSAPLGNPRVQTVTYASTVTLDCSLYDVFEITLTGAITIDFSNGTEGQRVQVKLIQDGSGSRIVTWGTSVSFGSDITSGAVTASTAINKIDYFALAYDGINTKYNMVACSRGY